MINMARMLIEKYGKKPVSEQNIEIIERKGIGHPDYIADAISERISLSLCKYYQQNIGTILHHNVDKGLVIGGKSHAVFGGGSILEPIEIIVAGRAVTNIKKKNSDVNFNIADFGKKAVKSVLNDNLRFLDTEKHVDINFKIRQGSADLVGIFDDKQSIPLSNDTSFGIGFAPLTPTETLTLETEAFLNSKKIKKEMPEIGEDIKVMALRTKNNIKLTISAAMISSLVRDKSHYLNIKDEICRKIENLSAKITDMNVSVAVNTGDRPKKGIFYLTVTGTSAEAGDDGSPGRGNRVNGLITPCRPMSLEATAGKNPVNHVGKTYNLLAKLMAKKILKEVKGIDEINVKILSQIGKPINEPQITSIQTVLQKGYTLSNISADIKSIIDQEVTNIQRISNLIIEGKAELF